MLASMSPVVVARMIFTSELHTAEAARHDELPA